MNINKYVDDRIYLKVTTYIPTCMDVNVSDNNLFVPNAVLKSMYMLYLSPSLCYIDSLCNFPAKILTSVYDAHNKKNNKNEKRVIGIAQLSITPVLIKMKTLQKKVNLRQKPLKKKESISTMVRKNPHKTNMVNRKIK